jgi:transcriptional regulator with PAS, ATPase and Fis domain
MARASLELPAPLSELLERAATVAAGAVLVLDGELRVRLASTAAAELLGFDVPAGAYAPKLLCRSDTKRPLAEALAAGRSVSVVLPGMERRGHDLRVRAIPLGEEGRKGRLGTLLLLDDAGESPEEGPTCFHGMWTQDAAMLSMFRVLQRVAPEDVTVLVRGETGTGKELVAQALHALSPRAKGPLRAINCAALPANLLESELFGHVRGAFTGAVRDAKGHVELAHRGTLFLDEVAELPLELQAKILRVLETRTVLPVGGRDPIPVDVRIVSATHRPLRKEVLAGRFRADLMYRLRVIPIFLPALRERRRDIALLCERICEEMNRTSRRRIERVAPSALAVLERHDWPGNVRELRNVLAYAYATGDGPLLQPFDLPPELLEPGAAPADELVAPPLPPVSASPEARRVLEVLARVGGDRLRAAQVLGISRVTLWRRMRDLGLLAPK